MATLSRCDYKRLTRTISSQTAIQSLVLVPLWCHIFNRFAKAKRFTSTSTTSGYCQASPHVSRDSRGVGKILVRGRLQVLPYCLCVPGNRPTSRSGGLGPIAAVLGTSYYYDETTHRIHSWSQGADSRLRAKSLVLRRYDLNPGGRAAGRNLARVNFVLTARRHREGSIAPWESPSIWTH
jgi:hypothetical protein